MDKIDIISLGCLGDTGLPARGTIGPDVSVGSVYTPQLALHLKQKLNDFYRPVDSWILKWCVDGRHRADGTCDVAPNAAGGTIGLVEADALTSRRFYRAGDTIIGHAARMLTQLKDQGIIADIGGHTGAHATGENSGCGANDKRTEVYAFMATNGEHLKRVTEYLLSRLSGDEHVSDDNRIPTDDHELIISRAREFTGPGSPYITSGRSITEVVQQLGQKLFEKTKAIEALVGEHLEKAIVINGVEGTSLNRCALAKDLEFGPTTQIFNLDLAALRENAIKTSITPEEARQKFIAMIYENLAVTCVLGHASLEILIRRTAKTRFHLRDLAVASQEN